MGLPYSKEKYARTVVWCLHLLLDDWPAHIPFTNLSNIKGGIGSLRLLTDLLRDGTLKFIPAPPDFSESRFHDLIVPRAQVVPLTRRQPVSSIVHVPPSPVPPLAEERVLHPETLEPVLTAPLGPDSSCDPYERHRRCDVNEARVRPVSNPEGRPMRARKIGALTSSFMLDRPGGQPSPAQPKVLKPLSELRLPVMVSDSLGAYAAPGGDGGEVDEIESSSESDSEDESERWDRAKRRRCV